MADEDKTDLIDRPHGLQEEIKMQLLEMIQEAADPFDIIYAMAENLEKVSAEQGYARHIIDNIHSVYGIALGQAKPLQDTIQELKDREQRIQAYLDATLKDDTVSEEERARLTFAIKAHQRKAANLEAILADTK